MEVIKKLALEGESFDYQGVALESGQQNDPGGYEWHFRLQAKSDFLSKDDQKISDCIPVSGSFYFTLHAVKSQWLKESEGESGYEYVKGEYTKSERKLDISGYSVSQPSLLGTAKYTLTVSHDGHSFQGDFLDASGRSKHPLAGTTAAYRDDVIDIVKGDYRDILKL